MEEMKKISSKPKAKRCNHINSVNRVGNHKSIFLRNTLVSTMSQYQGYKKCLRMKPKDISKVQNRIQ
jgi:hypothetical protein